MSLQDDLAAIWQGLCPAHCPRCGDEAPTGFCAACGADFVRIESACADCGLPRDASLPIGHRCPAREPGWCLDGLRAPFLYAPPLDACLQRLKYAHERRLGAALGRLLAEALVASAARSAAASPAAAARPTLIVAVPLHASRLRERTFNQADEIARPVARALGLTQRHRGIRRVRATASQTALGRSDRLGALAGAFAVGGRLDDLDIAIVDDVVTTGATVNALAAALKAAGARRVEAFAVARTADAASVRVQPARNR